MAVLFRDLIQENIDVVSSDADTLYLAGATSTQFQPFSSLGDYTYTYYRIISGNDWEVGKGYYQENNVLIRETVLKSRVAGVAGATKITLAAGATVICTYPADKTVIKDESGNLTPNNLINCTVDGTNKVGFLHVPQNLKATTYTCVLADAGKHLFNTVSGVNWVISSVTSFPIGTVLTFINGSAASSTINVNAGGGLILQLVNSASTGTRTLASNGMATAISVSASKWYISGAGLT